jgi:hypothetical protein
MAMSVPVTDVLIPIGTVIVLAGIAFHAGSLSGRFKKHETSIERRVDLLEIANAAKISREELDARFDSLEQRQEDTVKLLHQAIALLQRPARSQP